MESESVTAWIDQLSDGNEQAVEQLWQPISTRLLEFARHKLDPQTRRRYDENDAANSAFHSLLAVSLMVELIALMLRIRTLCGAGWP